MEKNPFGAGIQSVVNQLQELRWEMPFLASFVTAISLILVICILAILYPTVGLCMQLTGTFIRLIRETYLEMKPKPPVEKVGHAVAIGVYALCVALFGVVTLPFYMIAFGLQVLDFHWDNSQSR